MDIGYPFHQTLDIHWTLELPRVHRGSQRATTTAGGGGRVAGDCDGSRQRPATTAAVSRL
ncbi:hypothetical protein ACP70R_043464 [Stipagrostis hirtigluma subsp. patula]